MRPLFINRDFLFAGSPGGECLRAFIGAMGSDLWQPIVYASDRFPFVNCEYDKAIIVHENKSVRYIAAAIRRLLIPDITWLPGYEWNAWGKAAAKQIIKDIKTGVVSSDYIHSISYPVASHWAALKVKNETGLPWIMQFYDPWADSPYRPFKTRWLKKRDWEMERKAVEAADLIIHDNECIADMWRNRYGERIAEKIKVLPLTVPLPSVQVLPISRKSGERLVISHIGNFMLNRKAAPFIKAISCLVNRYPDIRKLLCVHFIGRVTDDDRKMIEDCKLDDIFNLHGTLTAQECEKYYKESDVFLAVDGVNPDNIFFPSKILKYFYFSRPILGITPKGSVMDSELTKSKHAHFSEGEQQQIVDFLYKAVYDYDSICQFDCEYWHNFEPQNVIKRYSQIVEHLLERRSL